MPTLIETSSVIGPIVLGIMILAIFFRIYAPTGASSAATHRIKFKGVLDKNTLATVHVSGGKVFENVRFVGFTDSGSIKGPFPFDLQGMVVLEHPDGSRVLIHAKRITMIEVHADET